MQRVVLRRCLDTAVSGTEAARFVAAEQGKVVHNTGTTMLVDVPHTEAVDSLRQKLNGWVLSEQGPKIPVPDTRLKIRTGG